MLAPEELNRLLDLLERPLYDSREAQRKGYQQLENAALDLDQTLGYKTITQPRPGKRLTRIVKKIADMRISDPSIQLQDAVQQVKDFAGGRILILYLRDILEAHRRFCDVVTRRRSIRLDGDAENYIESPKRSGYRGFHQGLQVRLASGAWFPFEVQFLTFLQLDWAQKEHLVYENPGRFPQEIREELRRLSDALHDISVRSDILRTAIRYHLQS
jgi:ppGpp synthetase/RelA/SpoT-type nucleotidyltranferase